MSPGGFESPIGRAVGFEQHPSASTALYISDIPFESPIGAPGRKGNAADESSATAGACPRFLSGTRPRSRALRAGRAP